MANLTKPKDRVPHARPLVVERLEMVSKGLFTQYHDLITELVGGSHGIYALYDEGELYYVGKSSDLRKRVHAHLRDRHLASWSHFSLYLVRNAAHIGDIESLLIRVANPKGNRVLPKGKGDALLKRELRSLIRQRQRVELQGLLGHRRQALRAEPKANQAARKAVERRRSLKGLVTRRTAIYRTYKGRDYSAHLTPGGLITFRGGAYTSPTAAAQAATSGKARRGWSFWYIKNPHGEWVRLADFAS